MRIIVCDRCKQQVDSYHPMVTDRNNDFYRITRIHGDYKGEYTETEIDLCQDCSEKLIKWIENKEE